MGMWVGRGRKARVAYGFDDIALVPGTVTINPNEVDIAWQLEAMAAELPGDVHFVRVDRHRAWHEGNVIEPLRDPRLPSPSDPHPHRRSSPQPVAGALPPIPVYRDRPRARILYFV